MKWFLTYIKARRLVISLIVGMQVLFWVLTLLYQVPEEIFYYSLGLSCLLCGGFVWFDFLKMVRQIKLLEYALEDEESTLESLPQETVIQQHYHALLAKAQADLADEKMRQVKEMNELLDYYTLWVHQVKTPIAAAHFLVEGEEFPQPALENELFKIEQYVELVLGYLRLGAEKNDFLVQSFRVDEVMTDLIKKYASLFIQQKQSVDYQAESVQIVSDPKWFSLAVEQILSNAIKYGGRGQCIQIRVTHQAVIIQDAGMGIKEEDQPRIFEKGYTGYNGHRSRKSSGLGLYLCKQILDKLGLDIAIESKLNQGTKVVISFSKESLMTAGQRYTVD